MSIGHVLPSDILPSNGYPYVGCQFTAKDESPMAVSNLANLDFPSLVSPDPADEQTPRVATEEHDDTRMKPAWSESREGKGGEAVRLAAGGFEKNRRGRSEIEEEEEATVTTCQRVPLGAMMKNKKHLVVNTVASRVNGNEQVEGLLPSVEICIPGESVPMTLDRLGTGSGLGIDMIDFPLSTRPLSPEFDICQTPPRPSTPNRLSRFPALLPPRLQAAYDMRARSPEPAQLPSAPLLSVVELSRGFGIDEDLAAECLSSDASVALLEVSREGSGSGDGAKRRRQRTRSISMGAETEGGYREVEGIYAQSEDDGDDEGDFDNGGDDDDESRSDRASRSRVSSSDSVPMSERGFVRRDFAFPPRSAPLPSLSAFPASPLARPLLSRLDPCVPAFVGRTISSLPSTPTTKDFLRSPLFPNFLRPGSPIPISPLAPVRMATQGGWDARSMAMSLSTSLPIRSPVETDEGHRLEGQWTSSDGSGSGGLAEDQYANASTNTSSQSGGGGGLSSSLSHNPVVDIAMLEALLRIEERLEDGEEKDEYMVETIVEDMAAMEKRVTDKLEGIMDLTAHYQRGSNSMFASKLEPLMAVATNLQSSLNVLLLRSQQYDSPVIAAGRVSLLEHQLSAASDRLRAYDESEARLRMQLDRSIASTVVLENITHALTAAQHSLVAASTRADGATMEKLIRLEVELEASQAREGAAAVRMRALEERGEAMASARRAELDESQRRNGEMESMSKRIREQDAVIASLRSDLAIATLAVDATRFSSSPSSTRPSRSSAINAVAKVANSNTSVNQNQIPEIGSPSEPLSPPATPLLSIGSRSRIVSNSTRLEAYPTPPVSENRASRRRESTPSAGSSRDSPSVRATKAKARV